MYYVFENRETQELIMSPDCQLIYRKAISAIREALYYGIITHGGIYAVEDDNPFSAKVKTICRFPNMNMMNADVYDTGELSVRGYHIAKRNGLNNAWDILEALKRNDRSLRAVGTKTHQEWHEYVSYCATYPERG